VFVLIKFQDSFKYSKFSRKPFKYMPLNNQPINQIKEKILHLIFICRLKFRPWTKRLRRALSTVKYSQLILRFPHQQQFILQLRVCGGTYTQNTEQTHSNSARCYSHKKYMYGSRLRPRDPGSWIHSRVLFYLLAGGNMKIYFAWICSSRLIFYLYIKLANQICHMGVRRPWTD